MTTYDAVVVGARCVGQQPAEQVDHGGERLVLSELGIDELEVFEQFRDAPASRVAGEVVQVSRALDVLAAGEHLVDGLSGSRA